MIRTGRTNKLSIQAVNAACGLFLAIVGSSYFTKMRHVVIENTLYKITESDYKKLEAKKKEIESTRQKQKRKK